MFQEIIVKYRLIFVLALLALGAFLLPKALDLRLDRTLKSAYVTSSEAYKEYSQFLETFGSDEFNIVAIAPPENMKQQKILEGLDQTTQAMEKIEKINAVMSLTNLEILEVSDTKPLALYPAIVKKDGEYSIPDEKTFKMVRRASPVADLVLSKDGKTFGIVFQIKEEFRFDPENRRVFDQVINLVQSNFNHKAKAHMVGAGVIREAVQEMVVVTTVRFGLICAVIIALVTLYIFKSLRVAVIATVVIGAAVYFVITLMALLGIPLNSTTSLAFGLVLVVSVATVIHIVSHYYESELCSIDREGAVKDSLRAVLRPCFMCALTTSVAFATIMVSSIPMVQQLGLVMSTGVLISFFVSIILTPAFLLALRPVDQRVKARMSLDLVSRIFRNTHDFVFKHYVFCAYLCLAIILVMLAGAPRIKVDTQILKLFKQSADTIKDLNFVETRLTPAQSLEVVIKVEDGAFNNFESWERIWGLQKDLLEIPEVKAIDSPIQIVEHLGWLIVKGDDQHVALKNKAVFSDVMLMIRSSSSAKEYLSRYLDESRSTMRISLRMTNDPTTPIKSLIERVKQVTADSLGKWAGITITGELVVFSDQASEVVSSQVKSLILAFTAITIIMIIQFKSWTLGLLSLIPNLLPIVVIFGVMGWFGIALDNVTIFAATIAIGLSVDDTIHYLTQLRREILKLKGTEQGIEDCLSSAYHLSAKALISTSSALFCGFLALTLTPTLPAVYFGFLGASAILAALLGDLVFMPSFILAFSPIKRLVNREMIS